MKGRIAELLGKVERRADLEIENLLHGSRAYKVPWLYDEEARDDARVPGRRDLRLPLLACSARRGGRKIELSLEGPPRSCSLVFRGVRAGRASDGRPTRPGDLGLGLDLKGGERLELELD